MKRISSKILLRLIPIDDFKQPISVFIQNMTDDETQIFKPGEIKNEEIQSTLQHFSEKTAAIFLNNLMMKPKSSTGFSFGNSSSNLPFEFQTHTLLPLSAGLIVNTYLSKMNNMSSIEPFLTNFNWSNLEEQTRQIIFESLKCKLDQEIGGRVFKNVYDMQIDALRETMGALKIDANESGFCI